jgi:hypothetical protein
MILGRLPVLALVAVSFAASSVAVAATITTYSDQAGFFAATGIGAPTQTFDSFADGTCLDNFLECPPAPGVGMTSSYDNITDKSYKEIHAAASDGAVTSPNNLQGGYVLGSLKVPQAMVITFSPMVYAAGFYLTGLFPSSELAFVEPATVSVTFTDESTQTFWVGDTDGSAATAEYFGIVSDTKIFQITVTSGWAYAGEAVAANLFGIDNLSFTSALDDTLPPLCERGTLADVPTSRINGIATDERLGDTGISTLSFLPGATNVVLVVDSELYEGGGVPDALFHVNQVDTTQNGQGVVLATDVAGNSCTLRADFTQLPPGPLVNEVLCSGDGILFEVSNETNSGGTAACSSDLYTPVEPALPPGYQPSPPDDPFPCRVLTIESPISGTTDMVYKKDGDFDPDLRLLFSESMDGGLTFPPFIDVTESVREIADIVPDPTRLGGKVQWTPVKVTCAILEGVDCGIFSNPGLNYDDDGYTICAAGLPLDCNDQLAFVHPGATERCNGMDDDCDRAIDEGNPGGGSACTVDGKRGVCADGVENCVNAQIVCTQTVFPTAEVCDGADNDCDGLTDENHVFGGYLEPVNPDGSSIFKWKRTIPFKFRLTSCAGAPVATNHPTIAVYFYNAGTVGTEVEHVGSAGNANRDNLYRYTGDGRYIYNLDTKPLAPGRSYLVRTKLDDGSTHDVVVAVRK